MIDDRDEVEQRLGRSPQGAFEVVVRDGDGAPMVIRNAPLLDDGTPMPTRFWLVDPEVRAAIGRIEAAGGVRRAEADIDADAVADAHRRYALERDAAIPADHVGPRPSGGVGGTRQGVKCLHAHYAWFLAGGDDPVGRWVDDHLRPSAPHPDSTVDPDVARTLGPTVDRPVGPAVDRTVDRLVGRTVDRLVGRTVDRIVDRAVDRTGRWSEP